jgi:hypothetical protein
MGMQLLFFIGIKNLKVFEKKVGPEENIWSSEV